MLSLHWTYQKKRACTAITFLISFLTFVGGHRLEQVEGNVGASADHGLQFEPREEREQRDGDDLGHALPDRRHHQVELVEAVGQGQPDVLSAVLGRHAVVPGIKSKSVNLKNLMGIVRMGKCQNRKVSELKSVKSWKVSEWESVRVGKRQN